MNGQGAVVGKDFSVLFISKMPECLIDLQKEKGNQINDIMTLHLLEANKFAENSPFVFFK